MSKNGIMEQRADIRAIFAVPVIREMIQSGEGGGIHVNMIGPIQISHANGSQEHATGIVEIEGIAVEALPAAPEQGPLLLRGIETPTERKNSAKSRRKRISHPMHPRACAVPGGAAQAFLP